MPYISQDIRKVINKELEPILNRLNYYEAGQLNYIITKIITRYVECFSTTAYWIYNEVIGVLECIKQEFYRRRVAPYEDIKKEENGDVF